MGGRRAEDGQTHGMTDDLPALPEQPERTARSTVRTVMDAAVAAVPYVGGPAQVFLTDFLPAAYVKRRDEWLRMLGALVNDIADRLGDLDVEALAENEKFVSAVAESSRIALGTHLETKLVMLKRALQHVALEPERDDFMTSRLLRFVDELSPEHFIVLSYLSDVGATISSGAVAAPTIAFEGTKGGGAKGDLGLGDDVLRIALRDLDERQLLEVTHPENAGGEPYWSALLTPLGREVMLFVEEI